MIAGLNIVTIVQGDVVVSDDPAVVFGTLLGSCVSVCLYDTYAAVGGMNHFLIPGGAYGHSHNESAYLYGANAMDCLIEKVLQAGGRRGNLVCKAFGGAALHSKFGDIGQENVRFLLSYLQKKNIECVSYSFGGQHARRIRFWPTTGKVLQATAPVRKLPQGLEY
ncbi:MULTISPECIES: chemotaxis protein CheD [unclassified Saccharibacter]|uniref:chemotaxis protein CheD n=1 Tax=unclassified Saccharibacter TaxID=2648722 RepID=UPI0013246845|nr:chemotaxis protein CheD [Saccharibacter sp. EH611]MXV56904.1 chemotaxis protein CheD [Saccharibacter sp. EH70]MXV66736.1 chemotaxis protein CheD [Saccharibacter sp. EH60]